MDHYETLGVTPLAEPDVVKAAYRAMTRKYHPDVAGPGHEDEIAAVTHAWDVLGDVGKRAEYDRSLVDPAPDLVDDAWAAEPEGWDAEWVDVDVDGPAPKTVGLFNRNAFNTLTWLSIAGIGLVVTSLTILWMRAGEYGDAGGPSMWIALASTVLAGIVLFRPRAIPWASFGLLALIWPLGGGAKWWGFSWAFDELTLFPSIAVTVLAGASLSLRLMVRLAKAMWGERPRSG